MESKGPQIQLLKAPPYTQGLPLLLFLFLLLEVLLPLVKLFSLSCCRVPCEESIIRLDCQHTEFLNPLNRTLVHSLNVLKSDQHAVSQYIKQSKQN